ncbi:MAG TPA: prolipoprotein diacylglyceryl transferase family protein [Acidimicrobiia bacterium]|jgi:prolipoprotein diacylglyceryltransferase|nr:prolipoprotein diacylglyceryl transferase family protein [Acidimicrobiia bacterium]
MEFTLLGSVAVAVAGVYGMIWWEARRGNAANCTKNLWDIAMAAIVAGVFVGRIAAMVADGVNPLVNPGDILIVRAGVATGWATVAAIATAAWLGRDELWPVLDGLAAASLAGLAGWHAGCLTRDACLGAPTDLPWAMTQPGSPVGRHPVELYAALVLAAASIALAWWRRSKPPAPGTAAATALLVASLSRLATEPLRPTLSGGPVGWYLAGVVVGTLGIMWSTRRHRAAAAAGG